MDLTHDEPVREGAVANVLQASGGLDPSRAVTEIHLTDGRVLRLSTRALEGYTLQDTGAGSAEPQGDAKVTIPLVEERLIVGKRTVTTGKVILEKTVQQYEHRLQEPLAVRTYDVERKILNQPVETAPAIRQEGETTIYPVVEEQLVLTKQLVLKEEIHVTRRDDERIDTQIVTLSREHLNVQRENQVEE